MLSERNERCFWNVSLSEKSNEDGKGVSAAVMVRKYQPLNTQNYNSNVLTALRNSK